MSVIDAFTYMFTADTKGVDEGLQKGDKAAKDITTSLNKADVAATKLTASFGDMLKGALAAAAAVISWGAVKSIAIESAEQTNALAANSRELRMNTDEYLTWVNVVERAGGTASGFQSTIKGMMGKGIREPLDALARVADRFKGLNDMQADKLGERLGLDKGLIEAMRGGREGLQKLIEHQQRLGMVTAEQIEAARKFKMQLQDTNTVMDDIRRRIATLVLPVLTRWLGALQELFIWMRDKKEFVIGFFAAAAGIITVALLPALLRATVATWAFIAPWLPLILLFTAVSAAIALVVDDVLAFREGGKSMIGEISKNWPIVGVIVNEICDALEMLWDIATAAFAFLADGLLRPGQAFDNFGKAVESVMDRMAEKFPYLHAVFQGLGTAATAAMRTVSTAFEIAWAIISPIVEAIKAAFDVAMMAAKGVIGLFNGKTEVKPQSLAPQSEAAKGAGAVPKVGNSSVLQIPTAGPAAPKKTDAQTQEVSKIPTATGSAVAPKQTVLQIPVTGPTAVVPKKTDEVSKIPTATGSVLQIPTTGPAAPKTGPVVPVPPPTPAARAVEATRPAAAQALQTAKPVVAGAASHPMSSTTSNSIQNTKTASKTTNVQTGPITVNTQATDAAGVADALGKSLKDQMASANDEFDDGIVS